MGAKHKLRVLCAWVVGVGGYLGELGLEKAERETERCRSVDQIIHWVMIG
jgi:hypothetical protein